MTNLLLSAAAGAAWNAASLFCLARLLRAWLGPQPSRRRVAGWLLVKCLLLYPLVVLILRHPAISCAAFGVGFTLVLIAAMGWMLLRLPRALPYGR